VREPTRKGGSALRYER